MKQPELGKKIVELRKSKGLTQEELVEKCNLNVRTLQRIESGEVTPRSFTIKTIFTALDCSIYDSSESINRFIKTGFIVSNWLGQLYRYVFDLFNLKTNTMKKISILSIVIIAVILGVSSLTSETFGQSDSKVTKIIEKTNSDFLKWFNSGEINSLVELYRDDACLVSRGCGKEFIKNYYSIESTRYKFTEIKATSVSVSDTIAVEKGKWSALLNSGEVIGGEYLSEWRFTNKKWLIVSESSGLSFN
jgi:transcriptional regulator with XRE-family HTH domain/ketosteroid isomerase-like protein